MAIYTFKDTKVRQEPMPRSLMPREAVQFNGYWLDEVVYSKEYYEFRTLNVQGRELLGSEVDSFSIGNTMGEYFRERKYKPRTIIVTFQILASSPKTFRAAFNKLNRYLQAEEARLIFKDEPSKFFVATVTDITLPEPGRNNVTGEIHFFCADPRKYAVKTKSFPAIWDKKKGAFVAKVKNTGNVPVPISYKIVNNAENGFIGIVSSQGSMQYGDKNDAAIDYGTKSQWIINAANGEEINALAGSDSLPAAGCLNDDVYAGGTWKVTTNSDGGKKNEKVLELDTLPSSHVDDWHGAAKTITLSPACQHFYCRCRMWIQLGDTRETGVFWIAFLDTNNNNICDLFIAKSYTDENKAYVHMRVGKEEKNTLTVDLGASGTQFPLGNTKGKVYIQKEGKKFIFTVDGTQYTYNVAKYQNTYVAKAVLYQGIWGNKSISSGSDRWKNWFARDYFRDFKVRKDLIQYIIPNLFQAGSILKINGNSGKVTLDGKLAHDIEVIGTKYFKAPHGTTSVRIIPSGWNSHPNKMDLPDHTVGPMITATATIREAWI